MTDAKKPERNPFMINPQLYSEILCLTCNARFKPGTEHKCPDPDGIRAAAEEIEYKDWERGFEFLEKAAREAGEEYSADDRMLTEVGKAIRRVRDAERERVGAIIRDFERKVIGIEELVGRIRQGGK